MAISKPLFALSHSRTPFVIEQILLVMIALPSIAFGGFSGSAKGVTARFQDGRSILSLKAYPSGYATAAQMVRRSALAKISKSYKNLSDAEHKAWENLAEHATGQSVFGQKAKLSGHNLFVRLNSNRAYCGQGELLTTPPEGLTVIPTVEYDDFTLSDNLILFTGVPDPDGDLLLVAKMSDGQSKGVSSGWGKSVIISPDKVPDWGDVDLTDAFTAVLGHAPVPGEKYFIELYWIEPASGFTGIPIKVSAICEAGATPNRRLTLDSSDILDDDERYITDMDVEFAPGSTILTAEITYDSTGHNVQEAYCHLPDAVAARTPDFKSYLLGRSLENDNYIPYFFAVTKWRWGQDNEFKIGKRGGPWKYKGIAFGTCPVFEM